MQLGRLAVSGRKRDEGASMKQSWTAVAVVLVGIFALSGCNDYGNTFQGNTGAFLSSLSPSDAVAGGTDFTLTLTGSGFVQQTIVQWNGKTLSTAYISSGSVTATVPAALIAKPGTATVQTVNPHSGSQDNGLSNPLSLTIFPPPNPSPTISALSPSCAVTGSGSFTLTITGTNFIPVSDPSGGSQVHWNTVTQTTLSIVGTTTSTQIQAMVSPNVVATAGSATVSVSNPPVPNSPSGGGGPSNGLTFTVASVCPATIKSVATSAAQITVAEETPAVSLDGRYVAFTAVQSDHAQIFLRDTCQSAPTACRQRTILLSVAADAAPADDDSRSPAMSSDGRFVAFSSAAMNLTEAAPGGRQIYLRDTCLGAAASCKPSTQLISTDANGALVDAESILPSVSASGRFVAFLAITASHSTKSQASHQSQSVTNSGFRQVFIRDTCFGVAGCTPTTTRISLQPGDSPAEGDKPAGPAISGAAGHIAIAGGGTATLFTRSVPVDDRVILSILKDKQ
jgi:hypothetical protein